MKKRQTPKGGRKKGRNADTRSKYDEQPKREKRRVKTAEKECQIEVPIAFVSLAVDRRRRRDMVDMATRTEFNHRVHGFATTTTDPCNWWHSQRDRQTDRQDRAEFGQHMSTGETQSKCWGKTKNRRCPWFSSPYWLNWMARNSLARYYKAHK